MLKIRILTKYMDEECDVQFGRYASGEMAISLVDASTGEPMAKVTVSSEPYGAPKINHDKAIYLKVHGENEGMLEAMRKAGIIKATTFEVTLPNFGTRVHECQLTDLALAEARVQGVIK